MVDQRVRREERLTEANIITYLAHSARLGEVVPQTSQPLDPGADLLPANAFDVAIGDPSRAVV